MELASRCLPVPAFPSAETCGLRSSLYVRIARFDFDGGHQMIRFHYFASMVPVFTPVGKKHCALHASLAERQFSEVRIAAADTKGVPKLRPSRSSSSLLILRIRPRANQQSRLRPHLIATSCEVNVAHDRTGWECASNHRNHEDSGNICLALSSPTACRITSDSSRSATAVPDAFNAAVTPKSHLNRNPPGTI